MNSNAKAFLKGITSVKNIESPNVRKSNSLSYQQLSQGTKGTGYVGSDLKLNLNPTWNKGNSGDDNHPSVESMYPSNHLLVIDIKSSDPKALKKSCEYVAQVSSLGRNVG